MPDFDGQVNVNYTGPLVFYETGEPPPSRTTIELNADNGNVTVGGSARDGDIILKARNGARRILLESESGIRVNDDQGREVLEFDAQKAALYVGADGNEGDIIVRDGAGNHVFRFDAKYAVLDIGAQGNEGDIRVRDNNGNVRIHLDGNTGDIKLSGADCAEEFDILDPEQIEAGTVMVIGLEGKLRQATEPYDKRVVGVVSGAGDSSPGIILDKKLSENNRMPMALTGKVYCQVDAQFGPVEAGDLLTTSPTAGHAMKASDPLRAFGAVIGKALESLQEGKGVIPVLVALQ